MRYRSRITLFLCMLFVIFACVSPARGGGVDVFNQVFSTTMDIVNQMEASDRQRNLDAAAAEQRSLENNERTARLENMRRDEEREEREYAERKAEKERKANLRIQEEAEMKRKLEPAKPLLGKKLSSMAQSRSSLQTSSTNQQAAKKSYVPVQSSASLNNQASLEKPRQNQSSAQASSINRQQVAKKPNKSTKSTASLIDQIVSD